MPVDLSSSEIDRLLVQQIRAQDESSWEKLIARYEGRLLAFVISRLNNSTAAEDVVQETFMGFLISLPNYDDSQPLESYLFSIAAHKLTDALRKAGRRPTIPLTLPNDDGSSQEPVGKARAASSLIRSVEQKGTEAYCLTHALAELIEGWKANDEWERLQCMELLLVTGWSNKRTAERLGISEQAVANHKHYAITKLKKAVLAQKQIIDWNEFGLDQE